MKMHEIADLEQLAEFIGANEPSEKSISRRVYEDTACGAWLAVVTCATTLGPLVWGVKVGSIVEGSEACVEPVELQFPFSHEKWREAIADVEHEADRLWNEANNLS